MTKITSNGSFPPGSVKDTILNYPGSGNPRQTAAHVQPYADALATAFMLEFGRPMEATDGARDLATQRLLYKKYQDYLAGRGPAAAPAAIPGESNHGWGLAIDFASNINRFSSAEHKWMKANAGKYGFSHPYWARQGGGRDEAWHWEYTGGGSKGRRIQRPGKGEIGLGATGPQVKEIQEALNDQLAPQNSVTADGKFGLMTALAVFKYQDTRGLSPNGKVGPKTLAKLRGKTSGKPTPAPVVYLKPGTSNVGGTRDLQEFLRRAFPEMYGAGTAHEVVVDGDYGDRTTAAVKHWQKKAGLARTGTIGVKSRARLVKLGVFK